MLKETDFSLTNKISQQQQKSSLQAMRTTASSYKSHCNKRFTDYLEDGKKVWFPLSFSTSFESFQLTPVRNNYGSRCLAQQFRCLHPRFIAIHTLEGRDIGSSNCAPVTHAGHRDGVSNPKHQPFTCCCTHMGSEQLHGSSCIVSHM